MFVGKNENGPVEYIPCKYFCQLIFRELEKVNGLTSEQCEAAIKKYLILGKIYSLLRDFHRIVFSHQSRELDLWITKAEQLQIDEVNTYINSLKNDIMAVKNGIDFKYNNGLAEGSVNKIS